MHDLGLLFARFAPPLGAHHVGGLVARREIKPAGQHRMPRQPCRLPRERHEYLLRDILREVGVAADAPQRRGVNAVEMPPHQFGKRLLVSLLCITTEQRGIVEAFPAARPPSRETGVIPHDCLMATADPKTEQSFCVTGRFCG
jgi:hypothetical protein